METTNDQTSKMMEESNETTAGSLKRLLKLINSLVRKVAQRVTRLPAMRETWAPSLGREDPLEKEMATHSNTLAWRIPWTEEPDGLQSSGSQGVEND